jgi:hypothetical protein
MDWITRQIAEIQRKIDQQRLADDISAGMLAAAIARHEIERKVEPPTQN